MCSSQAHSSAWKHSTLWRTQQRARVLVCRAEKLLVHRVEFSGADRDLCRLAEEAVAVKQNFRHSSCEVQDAIQAVYNLGFFENVCAHGY